MFVFGSCDFCYLCLPTLTFFTLHVGDLRQTCPFSLYDNKILTSFIKISLSHLHLASMIHTMDCFETWIAGRMEILIELKFHHYLTRFVILISSLFTRFWNNVVDFCVVKLLRWDYSMLLLQKLISIASIFFLFGLQRLLTMETQ